MHYVQVGTIMRAMGVYPTEKQWVKDMLDEIQVLE